ncbi:hypothetical protein J8F10_24265 [Gemmata sp. G18]|uniref:Uncharacterized protein n=1 Tax=Gemmata palustris TaxID=2822762 RepID=A0ABS5BXE3_9BACT|nr:hypothetical protein [Gemmata palustris]MBP3958376.1 hypothetical protein [Gemmata palustris]
MTKPRIDYPALFPHVIEGYVQGKSQMAIATDLNTHPTHISRSLHVHGLSHWKVTKLVRDGLTAQQIIEYATAKEPELPLTASGGPGTVRSNGPFFASTEEAFAFARQKITDQSQVILQQAQTIETYWECWRLIQDALAKMEHALDQQEIAERQKAGVA